ncbi:MAG TPA: cation diffusion facilitator family transporter [Gemmatimonadales bacterium]|nr:cation diffusion facilitator family transporter [Gemmatimonadales bacterium]
MPPGVRSERDRTAQVRQVLLGLLIANVAVVGAKFVIGLTNGSLAVLGDAVHSSVDAMNNVLGLAVIAIAARAPDEDHPYGHTKFETLGALAIVVFLSISGFELVKGSLARLWGGAAPLDVSTLQILLLVATLAVNVVVAWYEARRGAALRSTLLLADAAHTRADVFITLGVLASVLLSRGGLGMADPIVALIVAGALGVLAWSIIRRAVPVLVDEHAVPAPAIQSVAEGVAGVTSAYSIRSRGSGVQTFAEVTIAVDREATVESAHRIADAVELRLRDELHLDQIVVHVEPC